MFPLDLLKKKIRVDYFKGISVVTSKASHCCCST